MEGLGSSVKFKQFADRPELFCYCDKIEETLKNRLLQAEALRLSIIKKAFEGKLVPQNPSDEPAEKLLERIINLRQAQGKQGKVNPEKEEKVKTSKNKTQLA